MSGKQYLPRLSVVCNRKGVLDIDTVKGCALGMAAHPSGGCYGVCYANKVATLYGFDFSKATSRTVFDKVQVERAVTNHPATWFRIGVMGEPCHDWDFTVFVCGWLSRYKTPVIVTKSWIDLSDDQVGALVSCGAVVNISTSPLDTEAEREKRLDQFCRLKRLRVRVALRIVSVNAGNTLLNEAYGDKVDEIQRSLFSYFPTIDNPLRIPKNDRRVRYGDILTERHADLGGGSTISIFNHKTHIGKCDGCPDLCGIAFYGKERAA